MLHGRFHHAHIVSSLARDVPVPQVLEVSEGVHDWSEERELQGHQHWQLVLDELLAAQSELICNTLHVQ